MTKTTTTYLRFLAERLKNVRKPQELANALNMKLPRLESIIAGRSYSVFSVPKRDGSLRLIEDPSPTLKMVQRLLNDMLQALYYFERPEPVYGFVVNPADDVSPRHIVSHAERHVGCRWLLNIDLDDFFHQMDETEVQHAMQQAPLQCDADTARLIGQLTTFKERLPMGAPTSPVLSNWIFREEDKALTFRARERGWLYTRYADDLTFSSRSHEITQTDLTETIDYIEKELGYVVHPEKRRFCDEAAQKSVTRLVVTGTDVVLPEDFYAELNLTLNDLVSARRVQHKMGNRHTRWLTDYSQRVEGMLAFARHVLGPHDARYIELLQLYQEATNTKAADFGAYSWLDFPYM